MKLRTPSIRSLASLLTMSTLLYACGGADEVLSVGTTSVNTEQIAARKWVDNLPNGKTWSQAAASSTATTSSTASTTTTTGEPITGTTSTTTSDATVTTSEGAITTLVADSGGVVNTATVASADPAATTLNLPFDPRVVHVVDGDVSASQHSNKVVLQLHDGTAAAPGNSGSKPWRLNELGPEGYKHYDGSAWVKREQRPDGKWAFTLRIVQGQPTFESAGLSGGSYGSYRAEILGDYGAGNETGTIFEQGGHYWGAVDYWFDGDSAGLSGAQASAHAISWLSAPWYSSGYGHGWMAADSIYWIIAGPGNGPSYTYDVRTQPLSTTPTGSANSGGQWGTSRWWKVWAPQAGVSMKLIWEIKLGDQASESPVTRVWRKIGDGPLVKVIENYDANTGSNGARYWKTGGYISNISSFSGTRTYRLRSDLIMRAEAASGQPDLNENVMLAWLNR